MSIIVTLDNGIAIRMPNVNAPNVAQHIGQANAGAYFVGCIEDDDAGFIQYDDTGIGIIDVHPIGYVYINPRHITHVIDESPA